MAGGGESGERKLDQTPTWAVAGVCAVIILISFVLENGLHRVGTWLTKKQKKALYEALDKVKGELMVLGFISLLLTFSQSYISRICIPSKVAKTMLPCKPTAPDIPTPEEHHRRRLLSDDRRALLSDVATETCPVGYEPLITVEAAHQLHILIFFLAVFHVLYSAITMMLGRLKIRGWKEWERQTLTLDYEFTNNPSRFRLTHETSFVRAHTSFWTRLPIFFYVGCFFRQFFRSVTRADYLTLRNGFITAHIAPGGKFNFQKYIKRSLEDDFKVVVGVSPLLWASFVVFLLLNVNGWHSLFWASILPLLIIFAVGTKLQTILAKMALEIKDRHVVVQGIPLVQGSDGYFWFSNPQLLLHLLHFTLFQNAFQITYFLWIWYEFGMKSCFHDRTAFVAIKIAFGIGALVLCSYSTLPLYALVTQMGSHMKKSIFDEQTSKALHKWHMAVKKKQGEKQEAEQNTPQQPPSTITLGVGGGGNSKSKKNSLKRYASSGPSLQRFMTMGHLARTSTYNGSSHEDGESTLDNLIVRVDDHGNDETEMTSLPIVEETRNRNDVQQARSQS